LHGVILTYHHDHRKNAWSWNAAARALFARVPLYSWNSQRTQYCEDIWETSWDIGSKFEWCNWNSHKKWRRECAMCAPWPGRLVFLLTLILRETARPFFLLYIQKICGK
jgi:hypothetical protein